MNKSNNPSKSVRNKASVAILITAAALMLLISGIQQYSARLQIRDNLERTAEMESIYFRYIKFFFKNFPKVFFVL